MGQVLHGSATATEAVRRAMQHSQESLRALARRHGVEPKDGRQVEEADVDDRPANRPQGAKIDGAVAGAGGDHRRLQTPYLAAVDDCLYALRATIPSLTRSSLHRCLQRHAISRLPDVAGDKPGKQRFKTYPIGFFHIDIADVRTEEGKLHLYVAVDRTSKFVFIELHDKPDRPTAVAFLEALLRAVPYRLHTILTDNGIQFADLPKNRNGPTARWRVHRFDQICRENGIEHRLTKPNHPWTNGQVERMNRTLKEATVKRYHYDSHDQLRRHLADFVAAYNFARRLKTLRGLTPYEAICKAWSEEPDRFTSDPTHQTPGLNT